MDRNKLYTVVALRFPWRDRLRILFGREAVVRIATRTDVPVHTAESVTEVQVPLLFDPRVELTAEREEPPTRPGPVFLGYERCARSETLLRGSGR